MCVLNVKNYWIAEFVEWQEMTSASNGSHSGPVFVIYSHIRKEINKVIWTLWDCETLTWSLVIIPKANTFLNRCKLILMLLTNYSVISSWCRRNICSPQDSSDLCMRANAMRANACRSHSWPGSALYWLKWSGCVLGQGRGQPDLLNVFYITYSVGVNFSLLV